MNKQLAKTYNLWDSEPFFTRTIRGGARGSDDGLLVADGNMVVEGWAIGRQVVAIGGDVVLEDWAIRTTEVGCKQLGDAKTEFIEMQRWFWELTVDLES